MSDLKPKANREMSSTFIRKTVILMMLIGLSISIAVPDSRAENETVRNLELPVMIIESGDAKDAADHYQEVVVSIENSEQEFHLDSVDAQWKVHGRSSARGDKKPFAIKFHNRIDVLGMGAAKKWILISNQYDKSLIRNRLMYDLSGKIGMKYPIESRFVELYVNGSYQGVYQLCEAPQIGKNRVDINPAKEEFLLEFMLGGRTSSEPTITTPRYGFLFALNSIDYLPEDQEEWLKDFFDHAEKALKSGDRAEIGKYFDLESMVNGYILYEFSKNADLAIGSTRFIIEDGQLFSGTAWDFDLSCGNDAFNCDYLHLVNGTKPCLTDGWYAVQLWYRDLVKQDWFLELFRERYYELQPILVNLYQDNELGRNQIDILLEKMPKAIEHNYQIWKVSGNDYAKARPGDKTYDLNIEYLRSWLKERNEWITGQLDKGKNPVVR